LLGTWKADKIQTSELGATSYLMDFGEGSKVTLRTSLDTDEVLVSSGTYKLHSNGLALMLSAHWGEENGVKFPTELDPVVLEFEILQIGESEMTVKKVGEREILELLKQ